MRNRELIFKSRSDRKRKKKGSRVRIVRAYQHIYTSVEQDQSPNGRGGFQTLAYTRSGLSREDVQHIEKRMLYFPSSENPRKRVFFRTPNNYIVVGQIVALPEPDSVGRKGRYLAHNLVFERSALRLVGANPWLLFSHFPFVTTVDEALEHCGSGDGSLPRVKMLLSERLLHERSKRPDGWPSRELRKLLGLVLKAPAIEKSTRTVALVGQPSQVEETLKMAFSSLPAPLRFSCSFDTYFHRCNIGATNYWAVGLLRAPSDPRFIVVDCEARKVRGTRVQPRTGYERWAMGVLETKSPSFIFQHKNSAFNLIQYLRGKRKQIPDRERIPEPLVRSVCKTNPSNVREKLERNLGEYLPKILADRVVDYLSGRESPWQLFRRIQTELQLRSLLDLLYQAYKNSGFHIPGKNERDAVYKVLTWLDCPKHLELSALLYFWSESVRLLQSCLRRLTEGKYNDFVRTALPSSRLRSDAFIVSGKGHTFAEVYLAVCQSPPKDFIPVVKALVSAKQRDALSSLACIVQSLGWWQCWQLKRLVKKETSLPRRFRNAVLGKKRPEKIYYRAQRRQRRRW